MLGGLRLEKMCTPIVSLLVVSITLAPGALSYHYELCVRGYQELMLEGTR
jgi:hypothetical protein